MLKKMMSLALVLVLCLSFAIPAFAANTLGVTFNAVLNSEELSVSEVDQNVVVTIKASSEVTIDSLAATISWASPLELVSITGGAEMENLNAVEVGTTINNSVNVAWYEDNLADATDITDLLIMTFKVPANTETGTYEISVSEMQLANSDAANTWENGTSVATTLTITDGSASADGYTATIAGASSNVNPIRVGNTLKVEIGANKEYHATQMVITYPTDLVTFVKDEDASYTITENTAGTLELADYGDKKTTDDKYTLTFTAIKDGTANFTITSAKFGNGDDAKSETLTEGTCPAALPITIAKKQYTVTLNKVEDIAIFAGAETVLDGETYTFYTESATGAYYDYSISSVTMGDVDVTSSITGDATSGWSIANVNGDLIITGTRTPKEYDVTWSGEGKDDMTTTMADKATYGTDFVFTIPDDIPKAEATDGVNYSATITIGDNEYSPTVSGKTYTITGTSITGDVAITVEKTIVPADKVTVKVEGSTDITINGESGSSGSVNVEKEKDVTVQVNPEAGYDYVVEVNSTKVELDADNKYIIEDGLAEDATIEVTKTVKVTEVTIVTDEDNANGANKNFVTANEKEMYLIKMPDHINMQVEGAEKDKAYTYEGKQMHWSDTYETYVITVFCDEGAEPLITPDKFAIIDVDETPEIEVSYDVNQSGGVVDANDAQLIWNMYSAWYSDFETVSELKFILADANGDEVLNMMDAVVIINDILNITAN